MSNKKVKLLQTSLAFGSIVVVIVVVVGGPIGRPLTLEESWGTGSEWRHRRHRGKWRGRGRWGPRCVTFALMETSFPFLVFTMAVSMPMISTIVIIVVVVIVIGVIPSIGGGPGPGEAVVIVIVVIIVVVGTTIVVVVVCGARTGPVLEGTPVNRCAERDVRITYRRKYYNM